MKGEFCRFSVLFRPGNDFYTNPTRSSSSTSIKVLFIVLSLVAALLLAINSIIEVKGLPTHRDSATLKQGNRITLFISRSIRRGIGHQFSL